MSKNLIYMVAISDSSTKVDNLDYAQYSITSWERYAAKHDIDFLLISQNQRDFNRPIWNKELIFEFGRKYDKIAIVDSDTMIHPDAPNLFDFFTEEQFCGVNDICDLNWLFKSINDRQRFFPDTKMNIFTYLNAGVLFLGKKYLYIFEKLLNFYLNNKEDIDSIDGGGKEQTLLNFTLQSENVPITLLDPSWNLLSIHRKNMFIQNWQLYPEFKGTVWREKPESWPHFMKYGYVWHFTGFPIEDRTYMMSVTWDLIK